MTKFYTNIAQVGNNMLVTEYENGVKHRFKHEFLPSLFVPTQKESQYKGMNGEKLEEISPGNLKECRDFIKSYKDVDGFEIHGNTNWIAQYISKNYKDIDYDLSLIRVANFDIEVHSTDGFPKPEHALWPITAITVYDNIEDHYYIWGLDYRPENTWTHKDSVLEILTKENHTYFPFETEEALLLNFVDHWNSVGYDAMTGWNIEGFDVPYMVNRIEKLCGTRAMKRLSPWGIVKERIVRGMYGKESITYDIVGINNLDYLNLYKKYIFTTQESYTLGHIGFVEVGETKLSYEEEGSLQKLFNENFQKYIDYNIKDVDLVRRLDDKLKLIDLIFTITYYAKVNPLETFGPVKTWDTIIYNALKEKNIVVPPTVHQEKSGSFAGAFVKAPIPGFMDWVVSIDLNSLYPHLIQQYNLGPDTLIPIHEAPEEVKKEAMAIRSGTIGHIVERKYDTEPMKAENLSVAANGSLYRNDKMSFLSELMRTLYTERKRNKQEMLKWEQRKEDVNEEMKKRGL